MASPLIFEKSTHAYVVANSTTVVDGTLACLNASGLATNFTKTTGLRLIGRFDLPYGASVTGNGTSVTAVVRFFEPGDMVEFDNDGSNAVDNAGQNVYIASATAVQDIATSSSFVGVCVGFKSTRVLVKPAAFAQLDTDTIA